MAGPERPIWFAGDLADPWVVAIADALPRDALRLDCPEDLPDEWPIRTQPPGTVVLHRGLLTAADAQSLARLRARCERPPRMVLCVGPHARYADVDRWSRLVDVVLPEATASEVVLRHATRPDLRAARPSGPGSRLVVVGGLRDLRLSLAEACAAGGFVVEAVADWSQAPHGLAAVWDVPVLEPTWSAQLADRARTSPVVALLGFADRANVAKAREHGAASCLDSTCDIEDLLGALDRATVAPVPGPRGVESAHDVPPSPRLRTHGTSHAVVPSVADRRPEA